MSSASALCLVLSCLAGLVVAQEVEILRGTERQRHLQENPSGPEASRGEGGVEILYGLTPGAGSVDFETRRYTLPLAERHAIRSDVHQMLGIYRRELGIRVGDGFTIQLEIHGTERSWKHRTRNDGLLGFYDHSKREAFVFGENPAQAHRTALHESSHAILMDRVPRVPRWLNEGLAEYFEALTRAGRRTRIQTDARRHRLLRLLQVRAADWSLGDFFALPAPEWRSFSPKEASLAYGQAWSLVTFLMESDENRARLRRMLATFARYEAARTATVIALHYPGGVAGLECDWRRWLEGESRSHQF